jgi:hypothetical protein
LENLGFQVDYVSNKKGSGMKRFINFLFVGLLLLTAAFAFGQPVPEGLEWEINDDGKSVIITNYSGNAATVQIPDKIQGLPVTAIGRGVFKECSNLTSITIPASVKTIGYSAFSDCSSLTSITIPASVTAIDNYAFYNCVNLTSITVENRNASYSSIDGILFDKNKTIIIKYPQGKKANAYSIPSSVTLIDDGTFRGCSNLTGISISSSVTTIGDNAFSHCENLTSISIPPSVTIIGSLAFYWCSSLTEITIPSSVMSIGNLAFYECRNLTIVILSRRTQVGEDAFWYSVRITYRD